MQPPKLMTRALAVAVTLAGLMIAAAAVPSGSPRDRGTAWAKSLSAAERLSYIQAEQLAGLPVEHRKALFNELSNADDQTLFWQSVFSTYRREHALSAAQDSTLRKAEVLISEAFRARSAGRADQGAAVAKMSDEIKEALGPEAQRELFLTAGPDGRTDSLPVAERTMLRASRWAQTNAVGRLAARVAPSLFARDCNCNAAHDDCSYEQHCTEGLNGCEEDGGCACDWIIFDCNTCDGVCNYGIET